jgi:hypothetical protein
MQAANELAIKKKINGINIIAIDRIFIGNLRHSFGEGSSIFQTIQFTTSDDKHYRMTIRSDLLDSVCFGEI